MKLVQVMSFLVLTFVSLGSSLSNCLKNSKEKSSCLCQLKKRSLVMGSFHDVGAEKNGALIYQARKISFVGGLYNSNPLRPEIHIQATDGYTTVYLHANFQIDLFQTYLINTVRFQVYDHHTFIRTFDLQVFIEDNLQYRFLVYDNKTASGVITVKFNETFVKSIIIYNRGGNSLNSYLHVIRFQAFYAF